jgi:hypothetical protein
MKRKFIMMSVLIQGPKQPGNDIDVYLRPLVEMELCEMVFGIPIKLCTQNYRVNNMVGHRTLVE